MLTAEEARVLRTSYAAATAEPRRAAALLYQHLFRLAPETRRLFVLDLQRQGDKLIGTLGMIVSQAEDWPMLAPFVEQLALRHLAYGVRPEHYPPLGAALLEMLAEVLGEDFDDEVARAWGKAYETLQEMMLSVGYAGPSSAGLD